VAKLVSEVKVVSDSASDIPMAIARDLGITVTSQPAVGVFKETYRRLAEETDQIVSINLLRKLSATYNSARLAA